MQKTKIKFDPRPQLRAMREAAQIATFNSRTAQSDRAVLLALIIYAFGLGAYNVFPGVRKLSRLSGCAVPTVISSMRRLEKAGWIKKIYSNKRASGGASIWHLNLETFQSINQVKNNHPLLNYPAVWRKDALGSNTFTVFKFLTNSMASLTIKQLMDATGLGRKPVKKAILMLSGWGLVIKEKKTYFAEKWESTDNLENLLKAIEKYYLITARSEWRKQKAIEQRFQRKELTKQHWNQIRLQQKVSKVHTKNGTNN